MEQPFTRVPGYPELVVARAEEADLLFALLGLRASISRVRRALEWRAQEAHRPGLTRCLALGWTTDLARADRAPDRLPIGWFSFRHPSRNAIVVGPWWAPAIVAHAFWRIADRALMWCWRHGLLEIQDGDYWSNARWWPSAPRFE